MNALGKHLILDIKTDIDHLNLLNMEEAAIFLKKLAVEIGATVLTENWHHFGEGFGFTGVVVLAESHMTIHTWPEHGVAAIDIFTCGNVEPRDALDKIYDFFDDKNKVYIIHNRCVQIVQRQETIDLKS